MQPSTNFEPRSVLAAEAVSNLGATRLRQLTASG